MNNKDTLFKIMEEYEISDSNIISDLDRMILREMKLFTVFNRDGIRSLLNDFKKIIIKKHK